MKPIRILAISGLIAVSACNFAPPTTMGTLRLKQPNQADTLELYDTCKPVGSIEPLAGPDGASARAIALEANTVQIIAHTTKSESRTTRSGNIQTTTSSHMGQIDVRYWRCP
jgi:hypothetical protein